MDRGESHKQALIQTVTPFVFVKIRRSIRRTRRPTRIIGRFGQKIAVIVSTRQPNGALRAHGDAISVKRSSRIKFDRFVVFGLNAEYLPAEQVLRTRRYSTMWRNVAAINFKRLTGVSECEEQLFNETGGELWMQKATGQTIQVSRMIKAARSRDRHLADGSFITVNSYNSVKQNAMEI